MTSFDTVDSISGSIESFLSQLYPNKELIIVDGKSKDSTHQIIKSYQEKHPNLIKWVNEKDKNLHHARNIGVKAATGDIIGFLGADDVWICASGFRDCKDSVPRCVRN